MYDFLTFITRTHVAQDLPFGRRYLQLSFGEFLETPHVISIIAGWKKAFLHFGKVVENQNLTFPIRFRRADTTWNAKEKNDRVRTHFRRNCVCLNIQDFLRRVSEDGFTQKRTMLTFLVTESMFSIFFKLKCSTFRDKIPQLYNFRKLLPQRWLLVSHISFHLLKFYKDKCPEKNHFRIWFILQRLC